MSRRRPAGNRKLAVAYLRVSTDGQELGPEAQRAAVEAWAAREGVTVVSWHEDHITGGAPVDERPGLLAAVDALTAAKAGLLVVAKRDRLARDVVLAAMVEALVQRQGGRVVSAAGEGSDETGDPTMKLMRRIVDSFAEYERALIGARTRAALAVKRRRGERTGSVPYGATLADDGVALLPVPEEQAVIALARAARAEGLSLRAVSAQLASAGHVARNGRPFEASQVARMIARAS